MGETPFSMTYGVEAVIPTETRFPTLRSDQPLSDGNEQFLAHSLDLVEKLREVAVVRLAQYQQKLRQGFEKKVKVRASIPRDLVLQKVVGSARNPFWGKLGPNWEGPYQVTSVVGMRAYRLEDLDGLVVPRPWNVNNLQNYYF